MASYSVAEAKDRLPALIRAAKRGEEVVITRYGKPEATLTPVAPPERQVDMAAALAALAELRARLPVSPMSGAELIRRMRDEEDQF